MTRMSDLENLAGVLAELGLSEVDVMASDTEGLSLEEIAVAKKMHVSPAAYAANRDAEPSELDAAIDAAKVRKALARRAI